MSTPTDGTPKSQPDVGAAVRAHLDAEAAKVDAGAVWNNVLARLEADAPPARSAPAVPSRRGTRGYVFAAAAIGIAAALLLALFSSQPREAVATPATVIEQAEAAHAIGADRCYTQTVTVLGGEGAARAADRSRVVTICTRGDRFVVEPGFGGRGAWGRDETGRVWFAPTRDGAARMDSARLPAGLQEAVEIRRLELPSLLNSLRKYELSWAEAPARSAPTYAIRAVPPGTEAPAARALLSADLVVEKDSKLVRSLTLRRNLGTGSADVTFELVGTAQKGPSVYTAEGHIKPGAPVHDSMRPLIRQHLKDVLTNGP